MERRDFLGTVVASLATPHVDAMKASVEESSAFKAYQWTQEACANVGAQGRFRFIDRKPEAIGADQYLNWLSL